MNVGNSASTSVSPDDAPVENIITRNDPDKFDLYMKQCLETKAFCDVVLVSKRDGKELPVHKVCLYSSSEYFRTLFTSNFVEGKNKEILIDNISGDTLHQIVDYCYGQKIIMTNKNVEDLLKAAHYMRFENIVEKCSRFLLNNLEPSNCLGIGQFLKKYSSHEVWIEANEYINVNFVHVTLHEEFLMLNVKEVMDILSRDDINVDQEEQVFKAMKNWINFDWQNRQLHIVELLNVIRLPLLSPTYFWKEVIEWLEKEALAKEIVSKTLEHYFITKIEDKQEFNKTLTRKGTNTKLIMLSGNTTDTEHILEIYDHYTKTVNLINNDIQDLQRIFSNNKNPIIFTRASDRLIIFDTNNLSWTTINIEFYANMSMINFKDNIYIIGGISNSNATTGCQVMNITSFTANVKTNIAPMKHAKYYVGTGVLNGKIYAVGGFNSKPLDTVECYDPVKNIWTECSKLKIPRISPKVVCLNGLLYAVGGSDSSHCEIIESYNPNKDTWSLLIPLRKHRPATPMTACAFMNKIIVVYRLENNKGNEIFEYNPIECDWKLSNIQLGNKPITSLWPIK